MRNNMLNIFSHIRNFIVRYAAYQNAKKELVNLTDRELSDIGISRSDIDRISWESAENV